MILDTIGAKNESSYAMTNEELRRIILDARGGYETAKRRAVADIWLQHLQALMTIQAARAGVLYRSPDKQEAK